MRSCWGRWGTAVGVGVFLMVIVSWLVERLLNVGDTAELVVGLVIGIPVSLYLFARLDPSRRP